MTSRHAWAWISSVAVLFAGVSNAHAHLHLCFDGQEPPATVHWADAADDHHQEHRPAHETGGYGHYQDDTDHDDLDVDLVDPALAKTVKHDVTAIGPTWLGGPSIAPLRSVTPAVHSERPPSTRSPYLHPPLRGPPR